MECVNPLSSSLRMNLIIPCRLPYKHTPPSYDLITAAALSTPPYSGLHHLIHSITYTLSYISRYQPRSKRVVGAGVVQHTSRVSSSDAVYRRPTSPHGTSGTRASGVCISASSLCTAISCAMLAQSNISNNRTPNQISTPLNIVTVRPDVVVSK